MPASMSGTVICTVVTSNYLHFALALARSIRCVHADLQLVICIADRFDRVPQLSDAHTEIVFGDQLNIPRWPRFSFQYTAFELSCALKPSVIKYCLEQYDADRVVYLDADMQLYGPLNELSEVTPGYSIALTPHLLSPLPEDGCLPKCETFLRAGTYNGGFLAIKRDPIGLGFLSWWESRMEKSCVVRLEDGLFVDQRPLDLVPSLFDRVHILRRPGFHLAYWNLYGQEVLTDAGGYRLSNGQPVTLFHFSGIDPDDCATLSKHQDRLLLKDQPVVSSLIRAYINRLNECGRHEYQALRYGFATLSDGTAIRDDWRESIRLDRAALRHIEDPFDATRHPDLALQFARATMTPVGPPRCMRRVTKRVETAVKWMLGRQQKAA